jgi:hypothetical protein
MVWCQDDLSALRFQVSGVRFQLLSFFFLTPDPPPAEHLEHYDLMLGVWFFECSIARRRPDLDSSLSP